MLSELLQYKEGRVDKKSCTHIRTHTFTQSGVCLLAINSKFTFFSHVISVSHLGTLTSLSHLNLRGWYYSLTCICNTHVCTHTENHPD